MAGATAAELPRYHQLMQPTLQALRALGGSASNDEIQDRLTVDLGLAPELFDIAYPDNGKMVLRDRMSWARSYLKMAGLLASGGRGLWLLTDAGRTAADLAPDVLRREVERLRSAAAAVADAGLADAADASVPDTSVANVSVADMSLTDVGAPPDAAEERPAAAQPLSWSDRLLVELKAMPPAGFERLCQRLLRESGFVQVVVTGKSGDGGIDGSGVLRMNLISFHVLFQCKRYSGTVSSETVRNFRGAMQGRADKGLIITTGNFTAEARREATRDGAPAIDLIDGETLCQLLKDKQLGVAVRVVEEVTVDAGFFASI